MGGPGTFPHTDDQRRIVEPQVRRSLSGPIRLSRILSGRVDRIGQEDARWVMAQADDGGEEVRRVVAPDQKAAVRLLIDWLEPSASVPSSNLRLVPSTRQWGRHCYHGPISKAGSGQDCGLLT